MSGRELGLQLAAWRAEVQPEPWQCVLLFGVGPDTLERIEAGEVEPEADVAERITLHITKQTSLSALALGRSTSGNLAGGCSSSAAGFFAGSASHQGGGS